jgi:hypothetical protein
MIKNNFYLENAVNISQLLPGLNLESKIINNTYYSVRINVEAENETLTTLY